MKTITIPRKKQALVAFLHSLCQARCYERHRWLFCFNVKCWRVNLDFDHLVQRVITMGYGDTVSPEDPFWLADAKARYEENKESLFEWGIEGASRHFVSDMKCDRVQGAPWYADMLPNGDCYRQLRDGTEVDARFAFFGRSGGWLTLTMFDGVTLDSDSADLENADYRWLRNLAKFLVDVRDSTRNPDEWVEESAAFDLFANICHDCETRESRIAKWELDQSGEH